MLTSSGATRRLNAVSSRARRNPMADRSFHRLFAGACVRSSAPSHGDATAPPLIALSKKFAWTICGRATPLGLLQSLASAASRL